MLILKWGFSVPIFVLKENFVSNVNVTELKKSDIFWRPESSWRCMVLCQYLLVVEFLSNFTVVFVSGLSSPDVWCRYELNGTPGARRTTGRWRRVRRECGSRRDERRSTLCPRGVWRRNPKSRLWNQRPWILLYILSVNIGLQLVYVKMSNYVSILCSLYPRFPSRIHKYVWKPYFSPSFNFFFFFVSLKVI